jgi:SAM-dependent methyltransferase
MALRWAAQYAWVLAATTYDPTLYALIHRGTPGDVAFYQRACQGAERVLELGCGYGRLIAPLLRTGVRYQGLEFDPGLLSLAARLRRSLPAEQRARAALRLGDMRDFSFRERFDRVLIPHAALYCLGSDAQVLRCFERARAHLTQRGELVLDAYCADGFHAVLDPQAMNGEQRDLLTEVYADGVHYAVFERSRWDKTAQRLLVTYEYQPAAGRRRVGRIRHRYLLRAQLERLLARAGLEVIALLGDFAGTRLSARSEQLVLRARTRRQSC